MEDDGALAEQWVTTVFKNFGELNRLAFKPLEMHIKVFDIIFLLWLFDLNFGLIRSSNLSVRD